MPTSLGSFGCRFSLLASALLFAAAELSAFGPAHNADTERTTVLALVPTSSASTVAVSSGNWSASSTWSNGVPSAAQNAHIPSGFTVTYDLNNDANLNWVRIDGSLTFSVTANTKLVLETLVVAPGGTLNIGSSSTPLPSNYTARIVFRPDGDIDTSSDPKMFSRGLLNFGTVNAYGTQKTAFVPTVTDAQFTAGQTTITLASSVPTDWSVGDEILLPGTSYDKNATNYSKDDLRTISAKSGSTITLNSGLEFAHSYPTGYGLKLHVANLTRNIIFETENWSSHVPLRRAHTMHFYGSTPNLRHCSFIGLGRTDKSKVITDPGVGLSDGQTPTWDSYVNPRGRYAFHVHHLGASDINGTPVTIKGNVIRHSPGWGIAIHRSLAVIEDNITYQIHGAHIVTEDEIELVWVRNNMCVSALGNDIRDNASLLEGVGNVTRDRRRDLAERGIGFWFDSPYSVREFTGNVMAGMRDVGVIFYGHDDTEDNYGDMHGEILVPLTNVDSNLQSLFSTYNENVVDGVAMTMNYRVPFGNVTNNIAYNCNGGLDIRGQLRDDDGFDSSLKRTFHSYVEPIKSFTAFNVNYGAHGAYASRVRLEDCVFIGNPSSPVLRPTGEFDDRNGPYGSGINYSQSARAMEVKNCRVEGFEFGVELTHTRGLGVLDQDEASYAPFILDGGTFANNVHHLGAATGRFFDSVESGETGEEVLTPPYTAYAKIIGSPSFAAPIGTDSLPVAAFAHTAKPGLAVEFDASDSYDVDYPLGLYDPTDSPFGNVANGDWEAAGADNTIPFFVWDVDNNGTIDGYGRRYTHVFSSTGTKTVKLTVYDSNGRTTSLIKNNIVVANTPASEIVYEGNFNGSPNFRLHYGTTKNEIYYNGWRKANLSRWQHDATNGWMYATSSGAGLLWQPVWDSKVTRGSQPLKISYKNPNGKSFRMRVFGLTGPHVQIKTSKAVDLPTNTNNSQATSVTLLYTKTISTTQANWTEYTDTVDFGTGYEFLIIDIWTTGVASGEFLGIDNFSIANLSSTTPTVPSAPSSVTGTVNSSSALNFTVTDGSSNEDGFNLEYKATSNTTWTALTNEAALSGTGSQVTITLSGLTANTSYDFKARAYNTAGSSSWVSASATTAGGTPTAPTSVTANATSMTAISLSFVDASSDETGFSVEYKASSSSTWIALSDSSSSSGTGTTITRSVTGLTHSTSYDFRVNAKNSVGSSSWSTATGSTLAPSVFPLTFEAESAASLTLFSPYAVFTNNTSARPTSSPSYINWVTSNTTETNVTAADTDGGQIEFAFRLGTAATVDVWVRILAPNGNDNGIYTKLAGNDTAWTKVQPQIGSAWAWRKVRTYTSLASGEYTMKILVFENGAAIDQVYITNSGGTPQ